MIVRHDVNIMAEVDVASRHISRHIDFGLWMSSSHTRYIVVAVGAVALLSSTAMRISSMVFISVVLRRGVINRRTTTTTQTRTMLSSSLFASNVNCSRPSSSSMLLRHPCILPPSSTATANVASPSQRHHGSLLVNSLTLHDNDDGIDNDDTAATTTTMKTIMDVLSKQLHPNNTTIQEVLHTSLRIFSESSNDSNIIIHEPTESVLHLLSCALNLCWEDGFCQLREVLLLPTPQLSSSSSSASSDTHNLATQTLTTNQLNDYLSYIQRRLRHEPIQYIIGKWDFHNLIGLKVRTPMLCPRPETEELVELVLDDIGQLLMHDMNIVGHEEIEQQQQQQQHDSRRRRRRKIRVLDVGCGTGAIGIAIAYAYPQHVQVVAIDISSEAIQLSNENANYFLSSMRRAKEEEELEDGVGCLYSAILCPAKDFTNNKTKEKTWISSSFGTQLWEMDFDIIVSNPPYIPKKDMTSLTKDVTNYESYDALCGGNDGLDVVRDIIHRLPEWTTPTTVIDDNNAVLVVDTNKHSKQRTPRYCWMEVDDTHPNILEEWLSPGSMESIRHGVEYCDRRKDCFGRDRFVKFLVH